MAAAKDSRKRSIGMSWTSMELIYVFRSTSGRCHICGRPLTYNNYGVVGAPGAWEVDHSVPQARGGTDRLSNLKPACIPCNRAKQDRSTAAARAENGLSRAPLSRDARVQRQKENAVVAGLLGVTLGAFLAGPLGALLVGAVSAAAGHEKKILDPL
jgi:hypothetical protein